MQSGLNFYEARDKLNNFHDYLRDLQYKLKSAGKSESDVETKFKEAFNELCMKLEK